MSKYTTEVRFICENFAGLNESEGYDKVDEIINLARPKVFDFDYPIFDNSYKSVIETKILKHYYTREIGLETVGLWKLKLNTKLNEIMPYYNEMYKSALLEFNPLYDVDYKVEHEGEDTGDKSGTTNFDGNRETNASENEDKITNYNETLVNVGGYNTDVSHGDTKDNTHEDNEWNLFSDTPQGGVDGIEAAYSGVGGNAYLTDARNVKNEGEFHDVLDGYNNTENSHDDTNTKNGDVTDDINRDRNVNEITDNNESRTEVFYNTKEWTEKVIGKRGGYTYSKMLMEFRETILNIDMMVIDELKDLFFLLW